MKIEFDGRDKLANALFRLAPMAAKALLTLYMGRYFTLSDMGVYGLVFGAVTVLVSLLGQGFGYVVARDVATASPVIAIRKMRDQLLLLFANYIFLAAIAVIVILLNLTPISPSIIVLTLILTILESIGLALYNNMNSLNLQIMANAIFFVRGGSWCLPVILLGWLAPACRTAEIILIGWCLGAIASLAAAIWLMRDRPWRVALLLPPDMTWLAQGLAKCFPIWLGGIGLTAGLFVDRFFVERFLSLEEAGVLTFYFSFTNALMNLMLSGVLHFVYPALIAAHDKGDDMRFWREARASIRQTAISGALGAVALAIAVPVVGVFMNHPQLVQQASTFWLMLLGVWVRLLAEAFNYILYAQHQDRAIWVGNLLYLIPATGGNALLIPIIGLPGVGAATLISSAFLLVWRFQYAQRPVAQLQPGFPL